MTKRQKKTTEALLLELMVLTNTNKEFNTMFAHTKLFAECALRVEPLCKETSNEQIAAMRKPKFLTPKQADRTAIAALEEMDEAHVECNHWKERAKYAEATLQKAYRSLATGVHEINRKFEYER